MPRKPLAVAAVVALLVVASLGVVALGADGMGAADESPADASNADRQITVSATGGAEASPDQAIVRVAVTADGNDTEAVRSALADDATELRSALDELDVEYETVRYEIEELHPRERERRSEGGEPVPQYEGQHAFEITLDDTDAVGDVVGAATGAGAAVDTVRLTLSDERRIELRNQAIERAMSDARTQASTIAAAGELTVTGVAEVDASQGRYEPVAYEAEAASGGGDGGGAPTDIDAGAVTVSYRVQVTYNASA